MTDNTQQTHPLYAIDRDQIDVAAMRASQSLNS